MCVYTSMYRKTDTHTHHDTHFTNGHVKNMHMSCIYAYVCV